MYSKDIVQKILRKCPGTESLPLPEKYVRDPESQVGVVPGKLKDLCRILKEDAELDFDMPIQMTAVDYIQEDEIELVYTLMSTTKKHGVMVKSRIKRAGGKIDSVTPFWPGFDYQEREVFDLMGVEFIGHPNLTRIMMWDGFPGHPLRKDYEHVQDRYDSGMEIGTPGLDHKGLPIPGKTL